MKQTTSAVATARAAAAGANRRFIWLSPSSGVVLHPRSRFSAHLLGSTEPIPAEGQQRSQRVSGHGPSDASDEISSQVCD